MKLKTPIRPWSPRFLILLTTALALVAVLVPSVSIAATWTAGQPLSLPFPRLSHMSPLASATPAQIARYDYVILQSPDRNAAIRALNPNIILLNSNPGENACEISVDPDKPASQWPNILLSHASARWVLTQVGTTLTSAIGAETTVIPVKATTAGSLVLFKVGEILVIDDELCQITAVGTNTLTVKRGVVFPARSHAAGTRAAAAVTFWAGELVMDLTANCPKVTVDPTVGPESWGDWEARTGAALANDPSWDGVYIDRCDSNESWLIRAGYTRSIDPGRSNTVLGSYASFDTAWNAGMRSFQQKLRALLGNDRILFTNNSVTNGNVLNGTNFEDVTNTTSTSQWHQIVFGPRTDPSGSYMDWLANSRKPNLTTIMAYQYDTAAGSPVPPAGWQSDPQTYRKMRFGLATALLGDGFFSDRNGTPELLWLDEYDNAGAGKGYLGQPTGAAYAATPQNADLFAGDGAFSSATQFNAWALQVNAGSATKTLDSGALKVNTTVVGGAGTQRLSHPLVFASGNTYRVTFSAWASSPRMLGGYVTNGAGGSSFTPVQLTANRTDFSVLVTPTSASGGSGTLKFSFGDSPGSIWLDDVVVSQTTPEVWRRDFDKGVALVNADTTTQTVSLGGTFRKIKGTQAPTVNDGSLVTAVTLPPKDGIVLLRPAPTGTMTIGGGATTVDTLTVTAASNVVGATDMRVDPGTGAFGAWRAYSSSVPITLSPEVGTKTVRIEYRNLWATIQLEATVNLMDPINVPSATSPLVTTVSGVPLGWVKHDVTFTLSTTNVDAPDVLSTFYGLNAPALTAYSIPVTVADEGVTAVTYFSASAAGGTETTRAATIRIDKTPPALALDAQAAYMGVSTIHANASDSLSGLDRTELKLDNGPWSMENALSTSVVGTHTVCARALDVAGNESDVSATFTVAPAPIVATVMRRIVGASSTKVRKPLRLQGSILPVVAPGVVTITKTRLVGKKWRSAGSAKVRVVAGRFSYTFKPGNKGKWRFVATYSGTVVGAITYRSSRSGIKAATVK